MSLRGDGAYRGTYRETIDQSVVCAVGRARVASDKTRHERSMLVASNTSLLVTGEALALPYGVNCTRAPAGFLLSALPPCTYPRNPHISISADIYLNTRGWVISLCHNCNAENLRFDLCE